ncbi:uncharacterized protein FFB20_15279 [Fusarium fujikuroi]|nr:uncharacterized protein FFB20_15279 [Fusarium fujikuroi]SCO22420.1 uncharacterized protein FFC1_14378 [Fusarium fujikuroi]SCO50779.1 uncharacterized protein FFNC_13355 [Fusarium fujikuroi]
MAIIGLKTQLIQKVNIKNITFY